MLAQTQPTQTANDREAGPQPGNVAAYLPWRAGLTPDQPALVVPGGRDRLGLSRYRRVRFAELEALSNRYANGLLTIGLTCGTRTLLLVRPGVEFVALVFALFKIQAVPVLIDPGMGVAGLLASIASAEPQAMIGIPKAQLARLRYGQAFASVKQVVTVGRRWFWGGATLSELAGRSSDQFELPATPADLPAAILFTSGATGAAKGVVYEHGMFCGQIRMIQRAYGFEPGEIDMPTFPLFGLFSTAMGLTAVIPRMDPSHPAQANPAALVETITDHKVTTSFGSPALWKRVSDYCLERKVRLPSLRRVLIAGAPVSWRLIERLKQVLGTNARVHTPYGATECLPVASISDREVLYQLAARARQGAGICVGQPLPGVEVRVIRISDQPIEQWSNDLLLDDGHIGEIVARSPTMTKTYYKRPEATAAAKIHDGSRIWHRMGDVGYRDPHGRIWYCGRKAHRVITAKATLYSVPCEAVFNEHPEVERSALVGVGRPGHQKPVIVIETAGRFPQGVRKLRLKNDLVAYAVRHELTKMIKDVLFHPSFPVDVRHNVKINREALAVWASERVR